MLDKLVRYGCVETFLGKEPNGTILEVGAGPQGLGSCLPYQFVGIDPWYPEVPVPTQKAVRASAAALPFSDKSFDIVLCIETLEHVPDHIRSQVVAEMLRVARKQIIITHPYGLSARLGDALLVVQYALLRPFGVKRPWWLSEHFQYPLPNPDAYLPPSTEFKCTVRGQENWFLHNLTVFFGNLKWVSKKVESAYARNPEKMRAFMRRTDFPPYYRRLVVLSRD